MVPEKINTIVEKVYADGFCVFEDFINAPEIETLLALFSSKQNELKEAGIGRQENFIIEKNIRKDKIAWLKEKENEQLDVIFFSRIEDLIVQLNRRCFLGLNNFEFHFAQYEPGSFYKKHKDAFSNNEARRISAILYLNKNWKKNDGGELKIYSENEITVEPKAGTLVVFESHLEHEVLLSHANRISITGWLRNDKDKLF